MGCLIFSGDGIKWAMASSSQTDWAKGRHRRRRHRLTTGHLGLWPSSQDQPAGPRDGVATDMVKFWNFGEIVRRSSKGVSENRENS